MILLLMLALLVGVILLGWVWQLLSVVVVGITVASLALFVWAALLRKS